LIRESTAPFTFDELLGAVDSRIKKQETVQQISEKKLEDLRGNISLALPHELLTPLHGIMGLAALMEEGYQTLKPEEIQEYAKNIHDAGSRLNRLIENFLTYSRIELVAADPKRVEGLRQGAHVSTREIITDSANRLAGKYHRTDELLLQVDDAVVLMQPEHFHKVIEELLDNAFKFSNEGAPVRAVALARDKQFTLSITDRGRGFTTEQISRIGAHMQFDRKYYEQQGSGLGLIICKRLAEIYGGGLTVQSTPGQSTTVTVTLPTA
jgi:signal transduction histidine kinase